MNKKDHAQSEKDVRPNSPKASYQRLLQLQRHVNLPRGHGSLMGPRKEKGERE